MSHVTVLPSEVVEGLALKEGAVLLDATINGGGHSEAIANTLMGHLTIVGCDMDGDALTRARERLSNKVDHLFLNKKNFRALDEAIHEAGKNSIDGAVFDLGLSSTQLEESGRGFSFQKDEPLFMTMENEVTDETLTAKDIINTWSEESLANLFFAYGEERASRKIARAIVTSRDQAPITTSKELASVILTAIPKHGKIHPATKTFQALRIAVNDELGVLREGISKAFDFLKIGGRLAVISFHSIEDRIVKQYFSFLQKGGKGILITKRPLVPTESEVKSNPRSRSAKLRIIEKK